MPRPMCRSLTACPGCLCLLLLWQNPPVIMPTVDRHGGTGDLSPLTVTGPAHHGRKNTTKGEGPHASGGNITSGPI